MKIYRATDGGRWICGNIENTQQMLVAMARFKYPLVGTMYFIQEANNPFSETKWVLNFVFYLLKNLLPSFFWGTWHYYSFVIVKTNLKLISSQAKKHSLWFIPVIELLCWCKNNGSVRLVASNYLKGWWCHTSININNNFAMKH